jgi:fumarate reductase flavoprotein subunit
MGGIAINKNAQALTAQGRPVDGLYAAGNSIGGLEGGPRADYVGGLMKAFVFGLRAGEHAASLPTRNGIGSTAA